MANKLFEFTDRDESHKKLEKVLASGDYPSAECREEIQNGNGQTLYQVWDGSDELKDVAVRPPQVPSLISSDMIRKLQLSDEDVSRIADAILAKQAK